jgi:hypothetical protein
VIDQAWGPEHHQKKKKNPSSTQTSLASSNQTKVFLNHACLLPALHTGLWSQPKDNAHSQTMHKRWVVHSVISVIHPPLFNSLLNIQQ